MQLYATVGAGGYQESLGDDGRNTRRDQYWRRRENPVDWVRSACGSTTGFSSCEARRFTRPISASTSAGISRSNAAAAASSVSAWRPEAHRHLGELAQIELRRRRGKRVLVLRQQVRREVLDQLVEQQRRAIVEVRHRRHQHVDEDGVALGVGLGRLEHAPPFRGRRRASDRCPWRALPAGCGSRARSRPAHVGLMVTSSSPASGVNCEDAGSAAA